MTDQKVNSVISGDSRLSKDETLDIFRKMANSRVLRLRNVESHKLFGQGVWLIQAKSAAQLRVFNVDRAIYVPMASLPMFFSNPAIMKEKIDPSKEMLIAATYIVTGENSLSYIWTKVIAPEGSSTKKTAPVKKQPVQLPSPTQVVVERAPVLTTPTPRVNIPPAVTGPRGKSPFQIKPRSGRRTGTIVTSEPPIGNTKKTSRKKPQ